MGGDGSSGDSNGDSVASHIGKFELVGLVEELKVGGSTKTTTAERVAQPAQHNTAQHYATKSTMVTLMSNTRANF